MITCLVDLRTASAPSLSACRTGTARGSPSAESFSTAAIRSPKSSLAKPASASLNWSARATCSPARIARMPMTRQIRRAKLVGRTDVTRNVWRFFFWVEPGRPRATARSSALVGLVLRLCAVAADPRVGPVGDLALVLGDVRAPRLGDDRALGLPDDLELTVGLDL